MVIREPQSELIWHSKVIPLTFPEGLIGCPDWQNFELSEAEDAPWIGIMQSLDHPELSLLVAEPQLWQPNLAFDVSDRDLDFLGASNKESLTILAIINVRDEPFEVTANLIGPLFINPTNGRSRQIIQSNRPYLAQQPFSHNAQTLTFPDGLVGMPELSRFILQNFGETASIKLLVSQDHPEVSFPVLDPKIIYPEFAPELSIADMSAIEANKETILEWYCVLNIESSSKVTANLLGPIVVHHQAGLARQVILTNTGYSASHPIENIKALEEEVNRARSHTTD